MNSFQKSLLICFILAGNPLVSWSIPATGGSNTGSTPPPQAYLTTGGSGNAGCCGGSTGSPGAQVLQQRPEAIQAIYRKLVLNGAPSVLLKVDGTSYKLNDKAMTRILHKSPTVSGTKRGIIHKLECNFPATTGPQTNGQNSGSINAGYNQESSDSKTCTVPKADENAELTPQAPTQPLATGFNQDFGNDLGGMTGDQFSGEGDDSIPSGGGGSIAGPSEQNTAGASYKIVAGGSLTKDANGNLIIAPASFEFDVCLGVNTTERHYVGVLGRAAPEKQPWKLEYWALHYEAPGTTIDLSNKANGTITITTTAGYTVCVMQDTPDSIIMGINHPTLPQTLCFSKIPISQRPSNYSAAATGCEVTRSFLMTNRTDTTDFWYDQSTDKITTKTRTLRKFGPTLGNAGIALDTLSTVNLGAQSRVLEEKQFLIADLNVANPVQQLVKRTEYSANIMAITEGANLPVFGEVLASIKEFDGFPSYTNRTTSYSYDAGSNGEPASILLPDGQNVVYSYDLSNPNQWSITTDTYAPVASTAQQFNRQDVIKVTPGEEDEVIYEMTSRVNGSITSRRKVKNYGATMSDTWNFFGPGETQFFATRDTFDLNGRKLCSSSFLEGMLPANETNLSPADYVSKTKSRSGYTSFLYTAPFFDETTLNVTGSEYSLKFKEVEQDAHLSRPGKMKYQTLAWADDGRLHLERTQIFNGTSWENLEMKHYVYDSSNRLSEVWLNQEISPIPILLESHTYSIEAGRYKMVSNFSNKPTVTRFYDPFMRIVEKIEPPMPGQSVAVAYIRTTYLYDQAGAGNVNEGGSVLISKSRSAMTANGGLMAPWVRALQNWMDGSGRLVGTMDETQQFRRTRYLLSGGMSHTESWLTMDDEEVAPPSTNLPHRTETVRYADGQPFSSTQGNQTSKWVYSYSDYQQTATVTDFTGTTAATSVVTVQDGLGRTKSVTKVTGAKWSPTNQPESISTTTNYTYDNRGNLVSTDTPSIMDNANSASVWQVVSRNETHENYSEMESRAVSADAAWDVSDASQRWRRSYYAKEIEGYWCRITEEGDGTCPTGILPAGGFVKRVVEILGPIQMIGTNTSYLTSYVVTTTGSGAVTTEASSVETSNQTTTTASMEGPSGNMRKFQYIWNGRVTLLGTPWFAKDVNYSPLGDLLDLYTPDSSTWQTQEVEPSTGRILKKKLGTEDLESYVYYDAPLELYHGMLKSKTIHRLKNSGLVQYSYTPEGWPYRVWGGGEYPLEFGYDIAGRMTCLKTYQTGAFSANVSNDLTPLSPVSWPSSSSGIAPQITTWVYTPGFASQLAKVYPDDGEATNEVRYSYHSNGKLASRRWQRGLTTFYRYDLFGRLILVEYPVTGTTTTPDVAFTYNSAGWVQTLTDGMGVTTHTYAADGSLAQETLVRNEVAATQVVVVRGKDAAGRAGTLSYQWGAAAPGPAVTYTYDDFGNGFTGLKKIAAGGRSVQINSLLDTATPSSMTYSVGSSPKMTRSASRDALGRMWQITYTGHNSGQSSSILQSFAYSYDRHDVSAVLRENSNQWRYSYDRMGQVDTAQKHLSTASVTPLAGTNADYDYDLIGNRTQACLDGRATLYQNTNVLNQYTNIFNPQSYSIFGYRATNLPAITVSQNAGAPSAATYRGQFFSKLLTHTSSASLYDLLDIRQAGVPLDYGYQYVPPVQETPVYDQDGNLLYDSAVNIGGTFVSNGRYAYAWDAENRLQSLTWRIGNQDARINYTYDGYSRRVLSVSEYKMASQTTWTASEAFGYLYDGWNHIMTVHLNPSNKQPLCRQATYVWGPDVGSSYRQYGSWQKAGGVGGLVMVLDGVSAFTPSEPGDDDYFPLMDRMGNVTGYRKAATGEPAASLSAIYEYDAFGQEIRSVGPASDQQPYRFSTKFTQGGLCYYGYRWYDTSKGRWLGRDPIGERGGVNPYGEGNNNLSFYDPLGLSLKYFDPNANLSINQCCKPGDQMFGKRMAVYDSHFPPESGVARTATGIDSSASPYFSASDMINELNERLKKLSGGDSGKCNCIEELVIISHGAGSSGGIANHVTNEILQTRGDGEAFGKKLKGGLCKGAIIIFAGCSTGGGDFVEGVRDGSGADIYAGRTGINSVTAGGRYGVPTWEVPDGIFEWPSRGGEGRRTMLNDWIWNPRTTPINRGEYRY